jgi:hypothetical protein
LNSGLGLTTNATGFAPEIGVMMSFQCRITMCRDDML